MRTLNKKHLAVVKAASTDETRYTLNGVLIEEIEKAGEKVTETWDDAKGEYVFNKEPITLKGVRTVAADGRILAKYDSYTDATENMPAIPGMEAADDTATKAIIPTAAVKEVIKSIPKNKRHYPLLQNAVVKLSETNSTFGVTDTDMSKVIPVHNIEGYFPDYDRVFPKGAPVFSVEVNPDYLITALDIAGDIQGDIRGDSVTLEFHTPMDPIEVKYHGRDGEYSALVMPMKSREGKTHVPGEYAHDLADGLRDAIAMLKTAKKTKKVKEQIKRLERVYSDYKKSC